MLIFFHGISCLHSKYAINAEANSVNPVNLEQSDLGLHCLSTLSDGTEQTCPHSKIHRRDGCFDGWMDGSLWFYVLFNSISLILG